MVSVQTILTLLIGSGASFFMAWSIGAGSSGSTPFAPAVGANAISIMRAGFLVGLLGLMGATLQGGNVTEAVGRELIQGVTITPAATTIGLLVAAGLVTIGVFTGYPIATAFTVTGAMIGVGLGIGGDPAWMKYQEIGALWVLTPVVGGGISFTIARWLRRDTTTEQYAIPFLAGIVGVIVVNIRFSIFGGSGEQESIVSLIAGLIPTLTLQNIAVTTIGISLLLGGIVGVLLFLDITNDVQGAQQRFLLALGSLVAFSAGGSQVGLAIGPLLPLLGEVPFELPLIGILFGGGLGLLLGSWTGAPRMIKAISQDYSSLDPQRSIAALIPSFVIAQVAIFFGIPVSFNEIIVSAIIGSGYAAGSQSVSRSKMGYTILAWVGSFVVAFGFSYGAYVVFIALV